MVLLNPPSIFLAFVFSTHIPTSSSDLLVLTYVWWMKLVIEFPAGFSPVGYLATPKQNEPVQYEFSLHLDGTRNITVFNGGHFREYLGNNNLHCVSSLLIVSSLSVRNLHSFLNLQRFPKRRERNGLSRQGNARIFVSCQTYFDHSYECGENHAICNLSQVLVYIYYFLIINFTKGKTINIDY